MARKNPDYVLENFTIFLSDNIEGFGEIPWRYQFNFAKLAFMVGEKWRQHNKHDGFASITYQKLYAMFQKKFQALNNRLDLFDVTSDWSKKEGRTRGIKLSSKLQAVMTAFLKCDPVLSELIDESGAYLRKIQKKAIDTHVATTKRKETAKFIIVEINHLELMALIRHLENVGPLLDIDDESIIIEAQSVNAHSYTVVAGKHKLHHRYSESKEGRLYAKGVNLQNAPRCVTNAALHGCYIYDFENCHYSIFYQLASRVGIHCESISFYLNNKKHVRETLAHDLDIDIEKIKSCLISIMYGARPTTWHDAAIPKKILGEEDAHKASALYKHPYFAGILADIKKARPVVVSNWPDTTARKYVNAMSKKVDKYVKDSKPRRKTPDKIIMAYILQGLEARMLHVAIDLYWDQIVLLKHDGFSTVGTIDIDPIIRRIQGELDITMKMTEEMHVNQYRGKEVKMPFGETAAQAHHMGVVGGSSRGGNRKEKHIVLPLTGQNESGKCESRILHAVK